MREIFVLEILMVEAFTEDCVHIRWSKLTADSVIPAVEGALTEGEAELSAIAAIPLEEARFENTFLALEEATASLDRCWTRVTHLDAVCNAKPLRKAHHAMLPKVSAFYARIPLNEDLWRVLKQAGEREDIEGLKPIEGRLIEETLRSFRQNGAELSPEKKARLGELKKVLAEKTQTYSENVLDATNAREIVIRHEARLAGLPEMVREAARASAKAKGYGTETEPAWRFTLQAPSLVPVLEYAGDEAFRREMWDAFSRIGREEPYVNTKLIGEILQLRQELAVLLGEKNFADHVLEPRMAKDGETALRFIEDMYQRIREQFLAEIAEMEQFKAEATGGPVEHLEPWEIAYWSEKLRKKRYDFDAEALRPYFAIDRVIEGMFALVEDLYGLQFKQRETSYGVGEEAELAAGDKVEVWHPEVKFYDVLDANGEWLGSFYADWHPRETKRSGAWMNYLRTGTPPRANTSGKREPHIGLICGNLTPSVEGKPAMLTHSEVETVFHEFGHLLHHLLGDVEIKSLNGVNVVWDFVELPSQIMENFCWERVSLDRFALHYRTEEPIPEDLYGRMKAARNFQSAMLTMRQLSFGKMDLEMHLHPEAFQERDLDEVIDESLVDYVVPTKTPRRNNSHNFSHLFSSPTGYAAGYYSYKWAEVLDADAFTKFQANGVVSGDVGAEFRSKILSRGNARDAGELFRDFMGRDPRLEPLLERNGLVEKSRAG